jgi:asparagine synthase (glutamine-hydrolysing)
MCGINGIVYKRQPAQDSRSLAVEVSDMNAKIIHRGPDDSGQFYDPEDNVAMSMRRLSILDLTTGHQPIFNSDQTLRIVFNGEIYNFKELRDELEAEGYVFNTHTDTEVILKMYEKHGEKCVERLNGMFAFSISDSNRKTVFIARDRLGEKPLYYTNTGKEFIWASELKSIMAIRPELKQISVQGLNCYFALTYIPAPLTIYENVYKLKAGHCMSVNTDTLEVNITKYWDIKLEQDGKDFIGYNKAKAILKDLVISSVEKRMIADVPVGVLLSGGVDSTIVTAVMSRLSGQKVKTFSVGYKDVKYDESQRAKAAAAHLGTDHFQYILDYKDVAGEIDKLILTYDEPFADSSCIPTHFVSHKTRAEVKVALTGDGADEVFGGYNKYLIHTYGRLYQDLIPAVVRNRVIQPLVMSHMPGSKSPRSGINKVRKFIGSISNGLVENHLNIIALGFKQEELNILIESEKLGGYKKILTDHITVPCVSEASPLKIARYIDKQISLEGDMLAKVDRASMLASLECRAPFLDPALIEFTSKLPDDYLIVGNNKKRILKETFQDWLPKGFFNAPKKGFEVPVGQWMRNEMKEEVINTLSTKNLKEHGLLNISYVHEIMQQHLSGYTDHTFKLWTLFCFQKWYNAQLEM